MGREKCLHEDLGNLGGLRCLWQDMRGYFLPNGHSEGISQAIQMIFHGEG